MDHFRDLQDAGIERSERRELLDIMTNTASAFLCSVDSWV